MSPFPLRIAHRGMPRQARENTLRSFELAFLAGADGIELDVHCSADGVPVAHHDPVLADGTAIRTLSAEALRREGSHGDAIPTLEAVCRLVGRQATLFVEIKGEGIEREVLAVLVGHVGNVAIHSFDHDLIARVHRIDGSMRLGVLLDEGSSWNASDVRELMTSTGARDLWPHHSLVTREMVDAVHGRDGRVLTWTVNDPALARRLAALGVDGLCSDDVSILPR